MSASVGDRPATSRVQPIASVVVAAYNEEAVIGRTLCALLQDAPAGELDVVVVANGCTDRTADIARSLGVRVLETPTPGKVPALRLGDAACRTFPRLYLDADVALSTDAARRLAAALVSEGTLAAAPTARLALDGTGPVARRVAVVHDAVMRPVRGLAGVGVYGLSEAGHRRAFPLPDVIADDEWMHRRFAPYERMVVDGANSVVRPAPSVRAHLARRRRVRRGNRQLEALNLPAAGRPRLSTLIDLVRRRVVSPLDALCYLTVLSADRLLANSARAGVADWGRDAAARR